MRARPRRPYIAGMTNEQYVDDSGTRLLLQAFAAIYGVAGLVLMLGLVPWPHEGQLGEKARLFNLAGGVVLGAACVAWGIASVRDPDVRRRLYRWFILAHAAVLFTSVFPFPAEATHETRLLVYVLLALLLGLVGGAGRDPERTAELVTLFRAQNVPIALLRSSYEQRIRDAASLEERHRLARDLHDSIKQQVFVMQTAAATAQARFEDDPGGAKTALAQIRSAGREATAEMEAMLDQLRASALENTGLIEAVRKQCEALGFRTGAAVHLDLGPLPPAEAWPPGSHQALLRVAQEALTNVARHARATQTWVTLAADQSAVTLTVRDDGVGRTDAGVGPGMGIENMRARAEEFGGTLSVTMPAAGGTTVHAVIPHAARVDVQAARRRVVWLAALVLAIGGALALRWPLAALPLLGLNLGLLCRAVIKYRRARRLSGSMPWAQPPSPSSTITGS